MIAVLSDMNQPLGDAVDERMRSRARKIVFAEALVFALQPLGDLVGILAQREREGHAGEHATRQPSFACELRRSLCHGARVSAIDGGSVNVLRRKPSASRRRCPS